METYARKLLKICKSLIELGLATGSTGNISARDPETGNIIIKCSSVPYSEMELDDFAVLNSKGEVISIKEGNKPSLEMPTHMQIYNNHPNIHSIMHTHLKYAIILSAFYKEIPCAVTPTGKRLLLKPIPVIDFVENGSQEMAKIISPYFKDSVAVVMKSHGVFAVGDSIETVFNRTVAFDDATNVYYHMALLGEPILLK